MSHDIKYVMRVSEPSCREQVFNFLKDNIEDKENTWLTDLKMAGDDYYPVWKKYDITFLYSYKFDLTCLFMDLDTEYPDIDWVCELWDEEIGLCYILQKIKGVPKGWNITPDFEQADEFRGNGNISDFLRDNYYR